MNKLIIPLLALAAAAAAADDLPSLVQIDVEFIEIAEPLATEILRSPEAPKTGAEWRSLADQLIKNKQAAVAASLSITTKSGCQATAESAQEIIYPTEFEPPGGKPAKDSANATAADPVLPAPTPIAFEMRKAGMIVQVEPVLASDGKIIDLNLAPELVRKIGDTVQIEAIVNGEPKPVLKQPVFYTSKVQTSITLLDGSSTLAGMVVPHDDNGDLDPSRRLFCMVRARIVKP